MPESIIASATVTGAGPVAARFSRVERDLQTRLNGLMRRVGRTSERILKRAAPKDTRALADSIRAVPYSRAGDINVSIKAHAQRDGFNYLDITRFGHRRRVLTAKRKGRAMAVRYAGHRAPEVIAFAMRAEGYKPPVDWVEKGWPLINRAVSVEATRMGREIVFSL